MVKRLVVDPKRELGDILEDVEGEFQGAPVRIAVCNEHDEAYFKWVAHTGDERTKHIQAAIKRSGCGRIVITHVN